MLQLYLESNLKIGTQTDRKILMEIDMKIKTSAIRLYACGLILALSAGCSNSQDETYYGAYGCQSGDVNSFQTHDVRYGNGVADNFNQQTVVFLHCDIPYTRDLNNLETVDVRLQVFDDSDDDEIVVELCEKRNTAVGKDCESPVGSGVSFKGSHKTLSASLTPTDATRWPFLRVRLPAGDSADGSKSHIIGYRVCRGGC